MTKKAISERTLWAMNQLPLHKATEISEFAEFVLKRYEESKINIGIVHEGSDPRPFDFLHDEEERYSEADLKEKYHG
ncbi:MAG: hypothetical protein RLZZ519_1736 [Bacteroidota bacterium]|jgi:hypothetical protein